jgi:hypothetical protein
VFLKLQRNAPFTRSSWASSSRSHLCSVAHQIILKDLLACYEGDATLSCKRVFTMTLESIISAGRLICSVPSNSRTPSSNPVSGINSSAIKGSHVNSANSNLPNTWSVVMKWLRDPGCCRRERHSIDTLLSQSRKAFAPCRCLNRSTAILTRFQIHCSPQHSGQFMRTNKAIHK